MARGSTNGGADDTGRVLRTAAFPAMSDGLGDADVVESSTGDAAEQFAAHLIRKGRKGNWLAVAVVSALFGTGGFFGMRAAGERRDEKIHEVEHDAAAHTAKPAHDGAASKVEFKELDKRVQQIDKSVGELGVKIDSQEKTQEKRHKAVVDELKWLRRNR